MIILVVAHTRTPYHLEQKSTDMTMKTQNLYSIDHMLHLTAVHEIQFAERNKSLSKAWQKGRLMKSFCLL